MNENKKEEIPSLFIKGDSIPQTHYRSIFAVHNYGYSLRTQYDRKDSKGNFIDPPGKDARVFIEIKNVFTEPRFSPLSFCEIGKYIAEFLGAKDHLVVPYKKLLEMVKEGKEFSSKEWPYCYHQRLTAYPKSDGTTLNQLEIITEKLAKDSLTRRAVAVTAIPEIDLFMKEDQPCLREIQLRTVENKDGELILHMFARWRSRDLYKAWADNLIGISNLYRVLASMLSEKTGRKVIIGPYSEENGSLHIYGQDYTTKGMAVFFKRFPTEKEFIERAMKSEDVLEKRVLPELKELREEKYWNFTDREINIIDNLIKDFELKKYLP